LIFEMKTIFVVFVAPLVSASCSSLFC